MEHAHPPETAKRLEQKNVCIFPVREGALPLAAGSIAPAGVKIRRI